MLTIVMYYTRHDSVHCPLLVAVFRYKITDCEVIWAIKDSSIVNTFVDVGAAKFFLPSLSSEAVATEGPMKRPRYTLTGTCLPP